MSGSIDINNIPKIALSYIAGFFDGEGSIIISRESKDSPCYIMQCGVWQSDRTPLDYISLYFGGNVRLRYKNPNKKNNLWVWAATTKNALVFLRGFVS